MGREEGRRLREGGVAVAAVVAATWTAARSRKRQGHRLLPRASGRHAPLLTP